MTNNQNKIAELVACKLCPVCSVERQKLHRTSEMNGTYDVVDLLRQFDRELQQAGLNVELASQ